MKTKKYLFTSCCVLYLLVIACQKEPAEQSTISVISKIYHDGKLESEYFYDDQKLLERIDIYNSVGTIGGWEAFEYDNNGRVKKISSYNSFGKVYNVDTYTYDATGHIETGEFIPFTGADSGKVTKRTRFTCNTTGQIIKQASLDIITGEELNYRSFNWFSNGNLKSYAYYIDIPTNPRINYKYEYSPESNLLPENYKHSRGYPINYNEPYFTVNDIRFYIYDVTGAVVTEYDEKIENIQYNELGLRTEMTLTTTYILPVKPSASTTTTIEYKDI